MASPAAHAVAGAVAGIAPDVALAAFRWRRGWLPRSHPLVRVHAALHQTPWGLVIAVALAWCSHLVLDRVTKHNIAPGRKERRPWRW